MTKWRILFRDGDVIHEESDLISYESRCIVLYNETPHVPVLVVPYDLVTTIRELENY